MHAAGKGSHATEIGNSAFKSRTPSFIYNRLSCLDFQTIVFKLTGQY